MSESSSEEKVNLDPPWWVICLDVGYLLVLALLALAWSLWPCFRTWASSPVNMVPLAVLWWGALGAVTVSFEGILRHRHDWIFGLNLWHAMRPALGAIVGAVSYLIFLLVLQAASAHPVSGNGQLIYLLVAFLVGYREETFRMLIKRATDMLLTPAAQAPPTSPEKQHD